MVDDLSLLLAAHQRLLQMPPVADTGATILNSSREGYRRTLGSFVEEGFTVGMEVVPEGFTETAPQIVTGVSHLLLKTMRPLRVEADAPNRRLSVGLPVIRGWENVQTDPQPDRWYIEEDYVPGAHTLIGTFRNPEVDSYPLYVVRVYGLPDMGSVAIYRVVQAVMQQFPIGHTMVTEAGQAARVEGNPGPSRGQLLPLGAHVGIAISIPFWVRSFTATN